MQPTIFLKIFSRKIAAETLAGKIGSLMFFYREILSGAPVQGFADLDFDHDYDNIIIRQEMYSQTL